MPKSETVLVEETPDGLYQSNCFLITLKKTAPFFQIDERGEVSSNQQDQFPVYIHEYWHYLQNITTIAGFLSVQYSLELISLFGKTTTQDGDGKSYSRGSKALSAAEQEKISNLIKMKTALSGSKDLPCLMDAPLSRWAIIDIKTVAIPVIIRDQTGQCKHGQCKQMELSVEVQYETNPKPLRTKVRIGASAIEESVAYQVERLLTEKKLSATLQSREEFPYDLLGRVFEHIVGRKCGNDYLLAAIGTLALMSAHPGERLYHLMSQYGRCVGNGMHSSSALLVLIRTHAASIDRDMESVLSQDLATVIGIQAGRGLAETGIKHIAELIRKAFMLRREYLLFDLDFSTKTFVRTTVESINSLLANFPPCDVVQERDGCDHQLMRDFFGTSDLHKGPDGFIPSHGVRTLHAQQHFMIKHLMHDGFFSTDRVAIADFARCPYYTICELDFRKNSADLCNRAPWEHHRLGSAEVCWYGSGVASTVGLAKVNKKVSAHP